jgi:hypothetical protein
LPSQKSLSLGNEANVNVSSDEPQLVSTPSTATPTKSRYTKKRKAGHGDDDYVGTSGQSGSAAIAEAPVASSEGAPRKRRRANNAKGTGYVKYHQSVQSEKPEPYGDPPVWADKRQSLCETLPYYRAYQSGAYITRGVVHAFMVDKEVGPRDKFEEEILIARV